MTFRTTSSTDRQRRRGGAASGNSLYRVGEETLTRQQIADSHGLTLKQVSDRVRSARIAGRPLTKETFRASR